MAAFLFVVTIPLDQEGDQSDEASASNSNEESNGVVLAEPESEKASNGEAQDDLSTATEFFDANSAHSSPQHEKQDGPSTTDDCQNDNQNEPKEETTKMLPKQESLASTECESFTLEEAVQTLLAILQIEKDVWQKSECCGYNQVSFIVETSKVDTVLRRLTLLGIGRIPETSLTLFPAQSHFVGIDNLEQKSSERQSFSRTWDPEEISSRSEFYKSVKARLTVAQVVAGVSDNAKLTFDHLMLIILASCIAALGLSENSSVILVASMLISPLMGPILGFTFGIVVENRQLWKMSLRNSGIGLAMCILMGFFIGLMIGAVHLRSDLGDDMAYPTIEMTSRGLYHGLLVGIMIALASGGGVALAVLGGNTASLVGTAISASLLPPAVNAGMLWAFALLMVGRQPNLEVVRLLAGNGTNATETTSVSVYDLPLSNCTKIPGNSYVFNYSCHMSLEAFYLGGISLLLTILNIICICIMGFAILKFKEVVPHTAASEGTEIFWKKDIKIARDAYRTLKGKDSFDLAKYAKSLAQETKMKILPGASKTFHGFDGAELYKDFLEEVEHSPQFQDVVQRVPNVMRTSLLNQVSLEDYYSKSSPLRPVSLFSESTPMVSPEVLPSGGGRNRPVLQRRTIGSTAASVVVNGFGPRLHNESRRLSVEDIRWLFEEPTVEGSSSNVVMEYAVPRKRNRKTPKSQFHRMPSAPARVRVIPAQTGQKNRFKVTVIKEE